MNDRDTRTLLISRRQLLWQAVAASVGVGAAGALIVGCKKPLLCDDTTGLAEVDVSTRKALGYVEMSTDLQKTCSGCAQYTAAPSEGTCGGCKMFKGTVNPKGTCKGFVAKPAS